MSKDRPKPDEPRIGSERLSVVRALCERAERVMARAARAVASSNARLERALRITRAQRA